MKQQLPVSWAKHHHSLGYVGVLILFFLLNIIDTMSSSGINLQPLPADEMTALYDLYVNTGGESSWSWRLDEEVYGIRWNFTQNATSGEYLYNPCGDQEGRLWQGISCSDSSSYCLNHTCHVTDIILREYSLFGSIPASLSGLQQLQLLALQFNMLTSTIPSELGELVELQYLSLYVNLLTGIIPSEIGKLSQLRELFLYDNLLTGVIPAEIGQQHLMSDLALNTNLLTGTVPNLSDMIHMEYLFLSNNLLTGPLPEEIGQLVLLLILSVSTNQLSGNLSSTVGHLKEMRELYLHENMFTGSIPMDISSLVEMKVFAMYENIITGCFPSELGKLVKLEILYLSDNLLTGSLPTEIGQLKLLEYFIIDRNYFTGSIPQEIGHLLDLQYLYLFDNSFSGSLPFELNFTRLQEFLAYNNYLEHSLPIILSQWKELRVLQLQNNLLSGSLDGVFNEYMSIENLDLSNNKLSGDIPRSLFMTPNIVNIALSVNCFTGELPETICGARNISVLSLDGLGAAANCKDSFVIPLVGVALFNTMEGTIPACVWSLPYLQVLHLTSNGLSGSISGKISVNSSLKTLAIGYNQLTGTIPESLQKREFDSLDLSHNKLTGVYSHFPSQGNVSEVLLHDNRLSGRVPVIPIAVDELNILRGNLFDCGNIPGQDQFSDQYTCGSQELDISLYTLLSAVVLVFASLTLTTLTFWLRSKVYPSTVKFKLFYLLERCYFYMTFLESLPKDLSSSVTIGRIRSFSRDMFSIAKLFTVIVSFHLALCFPIYIVKMNDYDSDSTMYTTHFYQYRWFITLAYMKGVLPVCLILVMWIPTICAFRMLLSYDSPFIFWNVLNSERKQQQSKSSIPENNCSLEDKNDVGAIKQNLFFLSLKYIFIVFFNIIFVGTANGTYVYFSSQPLHSATLVAMQMSLALFMFLWNVLAVPKITNFMQIQQKIVWTQVLLLIFNIVFIPCVVTAMTSSSCFYHLLVSSDEVESSFTYEFCQHLIINHDGTHTCVNYDIKVVDVAPLVPPFIYSNLCSSQILTSFIPVHIFSYCIELFVLLLWAIIFVSKDYNKFPKIFQNLLDGVFRPKCWRKDQLNDVRSNDSAKSMRLLNVDKVASFHILKHFIIFFTFGISSPLLAIIILLSVCLRLYYWNIILGHFVHTRVTSTSRSSDSSDHAVVALSEACVPLLEIVVECLWPIIWSSALFFSFLCWDVLSDVSGFEKAIWAPLLVVGVSSCLWLYCSSKHLCVTRCANKVNARKLLEVEFVNPLFSNDEEKIEPRNTTVVQYIQM